MKKQINVVITTHPVRAAFLLILLFLLGSVMHQALGQGNSGKRSVAKPNAAAIVNLPQVMPSIDGTVATADASNFSGTVQRQLATGSDVPTNSITTLFASNNFSNLGGAVYFDLTVASSPISVTALDINTAETVSFSNFRVYVLPGMTSAGHETNMALWTQVATGGGTGAGVDLPTHVTLSNPFPLNAGTLYGIALVADPAITHHYTNGNGSNQNYSNANVSLVLGSASNVPFTAPVFSPRVWNGTVYYDVGGCTPGWRNEPPMTNARRNAATAVVGSNLYAITGFDLNPNYTTANERFNGTTWTALAPIPVPHAQSRGAAVGTNIYVPGGFNNVAAGGPLDTMQIYNTTTNTWSAGMVLPAARSGVATAAFNGLVYVIAGYNPVGTGHNEVYIYNPGTNSYTTGAPMTATQGNAAGVLFNGEIYVVGGGTAPGAQYAYNPTTNTWRTIAVLPTTGGTCQSDNGFVLNNELWVVGCLSLPINQQVWIYNPGSNTWRAGPPYTVDHQGPGAALFNGRGFAVGGGTAGGGSTAVESYGSCPGCSYSIAQIGGSIVPGTTDIGNHGDDTVTTISLPFPYTLYDQTFNSINLSSNGNAQFTTTDTTFTNQCLPWLAHNYSIFPHWDDQYLVNSGFGIFTSVSGTSPNRIFNIEWRAQYFPGSGSANFELRLYEGQSRFDIIYGTLTNGNTSATAGVQKDDITFTQYFCNGSGGAATGGQSYTLQSCGPVPSSAVSRKVHGAFTGDINLPVVAIGGAVGIECRNGAGVYQMVVTFPSPVTVGEVSVTSGTGSVGSSIVSGGVVTINLTGVTDAQRLGVTLANVNDGTSTGDVFVPMGVLIGDSAGTGNGSVNAGDVGFVKSQSGIAVGAGNFRADVAINGTINASDIGLVKANSGHSLPP